MAENSYPVQFAGRWAIDIFSFHQDISSFVIGIPS
jgi:hypothetical protein